MTTSFARLFLTTIPPVATVEDGETYGFLNSLTGTLIVGSPPVGNGDNFPELFGGVFATESQTLDGVVYGALGNDRTGNVILPGVDEVELAVAFGPNGSLIGTLEGGGPELESPLCLVTIPIVNQFGVRVPGVSVSFKFAGLQASAATGGVIMSPPPAEVSNANGVVQVSLIRLVNYTATFRLEGEARNLPIQVPDAGSYTVADT